MTNIAEKELSFFRDGKKIYAKEFSSSGSNAAEAKLPVMILSHGFGSNARDLEGYSRVFAQMGYVAYCFDFCGGSVAGMGRSEGTSLDMTIETECADLIAVIESVKTFSYVDADRISLIGWSQGGFISGLVAAGLGERD